MCTYRVKHTQKQQSTLKVTKEVWPIPGDKHQQHMHEREGEREERERERNTERHQ